MILPAETVINEALFGNENGETHSDQPMFFCRSNFKSTPLVALAMCLLASCGDEPVMTLPKMEDLAGNWECLELPERTKSAIGEASKASKLGKIVLERNGSFSVTNFPMSEPLRLADRKGLWTLLDPTMTPSGICSIELDGVFLSIRRRGSHLVLRYPIDVLEGYSAEYMKAEQ